MKIAAKDGADQKVRGSDAYEDNEAASTRGTVEHRNRLQIRRPKKAAADELPILLGQVFEEDTAEISADGEKKLEAVLPRLKCQPQGSSITVVTTGEDDLFLEALSRARLTHLQNWFREHGADTTSIEPRWRGGSADDVQVKFGQ